MQEELGLEQPQEYRVLDPPLQAENDRPSILSGVDQSLVCEKLDQLKYNPICTKRRNDVLAIHLHQLSSAVLIQSHQEHLLTKITSLKQDKDKTLFFLLFQIQSSQS